MVEKEVWVENRFGLHARPAAQLMNLAKQFDATIILEKDDFQAEAKELLSLLALDCSPGTRLVIRASGPEAREAAQAVANLFARKFGES